MWASMLLLFQHIVAVVVIVIAVVVFAIVDVALLLFVAVSLKIGT